MDHHAPIDSASGEFAALTDPNVSTALREAFDFLGVARSTLRESLGLLALAEAHPGVFRCRGSDPRASNALGFLRDEAQAAAIAYVDAKRVFSDEYTKARGGKV